MVDGAERLKNAVTLALSLFAVPVVGALSALYLARRGADGANVMRASIAIAMLGAALIALVVGARVVAGRDQRRMSLVFGPLIRVVLALLAASVLAQGALLVYCVYALEKALIGHVTLALLIGVAIGAAAACLQLLRGAFGVFTIAPSFVRAALLDPAKHRALFGVVHSIAKKLGAKPPRHIVVGIEPNFYVTANDVVTAIPNAGCAAGRCTCRSA